MKIIGKWFYVLFVMGFSYNHSDCLTHVSDSQHYSISLGEEWEYIEQTVLKRAESDVYARTGQINRYTVGFKLAGNNDFEYPYILIQEEERKSLSMKDYEALFTSEEASSDIVNKYPGYRNVLDNVSLNKPFADKEKGIVYMIISSDVSNIGNVTALVGLVFGKKNIAAVYCNATSTTFDTHYKDFVRIIESCTFEPDYKYSGLTKFLGERGVTRKGSLLSLFGEKTIVGLFTAGLWGLIVLIVIFVSRILRKKTKPYSYGIIDYKNIPLKDLEQRLMAISDINEVNNIGVTAIMTACGTTEDIEKIKLLLEKGADVNKTSNNGMNALILASSLNENLEVVKLIRSMCSNIDQKTNKGRTALSFAAECNNNTEVVAYLINEGADINSKDHDQKTPLIWACAFGECENNVLHLIERGAKLGVKDNTGYTAYEHIVKNDMLKNSRARDILRVKTGAYF